ncbi:MAG: hypothetical protein IPL53_25210 [Ignavibacteria bacterium]|nr:hypothetical protein [Ignavibacteria bacterium]
MKQSFKFYAAIFLSCMLFQNSFSQQNINGWQWVNSKAQSNTINWIKILDDTHYYAVGENGTFMKSTDGGDSWRINTQAGTTDPLFGSGATYTLNSAWFFDANTGLVAGQSEVGDGGKVRRTTDAGETFTTINLGGLSTGSPRVYDIYFINSTTGYLCGNNTIKALKTTNAGASWTLMPNMPSAAYTYSSIYAKDENNIIIGLNSDGLYRRIIKTTNAGATWTTIDLPWSTIIDVTDIQFQNANTGFISGNSTSNNPPYFAHTTDGGSTWTEALFPNKEHGLYDLEIIGSTAYVLGGNFGHYYFTSDLGVTWDSVDYNDYNNIYQPFQWFVYSFSIKGSDAIVAGMNGKINVSNDAGSTWRNKNYSVGNCVTQMPSIYALPGTGKVWAGTRAGGKILYSSDRGNTWSEQQTTEQYAFYQINMVNSYTGYAVGGNLVNGVGYCLKTVNSGLNWTKLTIPTPTFEIWSVDFVNANTGWIVGGLPSGFGAVIAKTTNGGLTWTNQVATSNPLINSTISYIDMSDANVGYIAYGTGVYKTSNGGTNWNKINTVPSGSFRRVNTFSNTTVFASSGQTIYKTLDGGTSWTSVTIPSPLADIFSMDWVDLDNGTVVGTQGYSAKTSDGGQTWTERNTGTSTLWEVSMVSKDTVFAVAGINTSGAIFRLIDNTPSSVSFNVKVGIQGFWNGTTQVSDTVKCHLRSSVAPYNEIESDAAVLNSSGEGTFTFNTSLSGTYYIEITHRNSIETWSKLPVSIVAEGSYDFTTSATQAYGDNIILKSGKYCNYSGDVNQDGFVNLTDVLAVFNSSSSFVNGYVTSDVNGDNTVDLSDIALTYNNSSAFVQKIIP